MLKDREGHEIRIAQEGNGHMLVYGKSGQGKTYFLCRMLEKYCEEGKKVLIIDYSGSYLHKELQEKGFQHLKNVKRYTVSEYGVSWQFRVHDNEKFQKDVTDALLEVLKCGGYFQKKLLGDAVGKIVQKGERVSLPKVMAELRKMLLEEEKTEEILGNKENIGKLLTRLAPYEDMKNFNIEKGKTRDENIMPITIFDLVDFPEGQRKFLAEFMTSLLWHETYRQEFRNHCDVLLLDEMQFLSIREGSTLFSMLREGRKKGMEVVLSTQFISHYDKAEIQALQQADNMLIFSPTPEDCKRSAKIIDSVEGKSWEKILQGLKKGEAVLKGNYRVDGRSRVSFDPIVVRILESCAENRVKKI